MRATNRLSYKKDLLRNAEGGEQIKIRIMQKLYTLLFVLIIIGINSCTDSAGGSIDEVGPVVQLGAAPSITGPNGGMNFVFLEEEEDKALPSITWTAADFGYSAAVTYDVQIDVAGNNFSNALSLGLTNSLALEGLTVGFLNNFLFAQGFPELQAIDMEIRLVAKVSEEVDVLISNPVPLTFTLYEVIIIYPQLHLPGDYQEWDPSTQVHVIFSALSNKKYEGFNYFNLDDALFKFTDGPSWDVNWGDEEPDGKLDPQGIGNDIPIGGEAGAYFLTCNLNAFSYTIEPAFMSAIGGATEGEDIAFEYDAANNQLMVTTDLVAGDLKFRANGEDALSLGDDAGNGKLLFGEGAFSVTEAGNYTIKLNILNVVEYSYELIKN